MSRRSRHPVSPKIEERVFKIFVDSIKNANTAQDVVTFLNDLLSSAERVMLAKRVAIAFLLLEGKYTYDDISKTLKVSRGTIAKVHSVLILQGTGYKKILGDMLKRKVLKILLAELLEGLTPLPSKGANWGEWKKSRLKAKWKREEPL